MQNEQMIKVVMLILAGKTLIFAQYYIKFDN